MKKILLFTYLFSVTAFYCYSQNLILFDSTAGQLVNNATILKTGNTGTGEIIQHLAIKNNSSTDIDVMVKKTYISVLEGTLNVFCWGVCFGPDTYVSSDPLTIPAGTTNSLDFSGHYQPYDVSGISTIRYTFFSRLDANDSTCVNVNFAAYPLGLNETNAGNPSISSPYPNPANNQVTFNYSLPAGTHGSLILRNILGETVTKTDLPGIAGKITLSATDLTEGIYFYSLMQDREVILTKKMVVKH